MNVKHILFLLLIFILSNAKAQEVEDNIRMVKPFKADGISNEWNEPLNEYNEATKLAFALANDDKNLYIIIESLDPQTTFSVLHGGITLNINAEGKKKKGVNLVFPLRDGSANAENHQNDKDYGLLHPIKEEVLAEQLLINKKIAVSGFKNIPNGDLSLSNSYGIETGMSVNSNRDLIYELSIPLAELQVDLNAKKPLMYNIKINSPAKLNFKKTGQLESGNHSGGMSRGGMGSRGGTGGGRAGGMGGRGQRPPEGAVSENKASDFWIKFRLVKS